MDLKDAERQSQGGESQVAGVKEGGIHSFEEEQPVNLLENKFNRNFRLVVESALSYSHLFTQQEIKSYLHTYLYKLSPLAQTLFARLSLRKRTWFNTSIHLDGYKQHGLNAARAARTDSKPQTSLEDFDETLSTLGDGSEEVLAAVFELKEHGFICLDQEVLYQGIVRAIERDLLKCFER